MANLFNDNCIAYYTEKNQINKLKDSSKKKLKIIDSQLKNLNTHNPLLIVHAEKFLKHKKAAIISQFTVMEKIISNTIKFDCNNLNSIVEKNYEIKNNDKQNIPDYGNELSDLLYPNSSIEQSGGSFNILEHKINKYLQKISLDNSNNKVDKYLQLLNKHIQNGGEITTNNDVLINNILNDRYNLLTDIEKYKESKKKINDSDCITNNYDEEDIDITQPTSKYFGTKYLCINSNTVYDKNYDESKYNYFFRRGLKSKATDLFMHNVLNENYGSFYNELCNYVHFELSSFFYEFIFKYNVRMIRVNPNKMLDVNDIILLYKGGNTTKMYIGILLNNLKKLNNEFPFENITNMYNDLTVGDWDFNVSINFKNLQIKNYNKDEILKIINQCKQICVIALGKIKKTLIHLIDSGISKDYATEMKKKFINEINPVINDYKYKMNGVYYKLMQEFNEQIDNDKKIESTPTAAPTAAQNLKKKIKSIKIKTKIDKLNLYNYVVDFTKPNKKLEEDSTLENKFNNTNLFKESYIITDNPVNPENDDIMKYRKNVDSVVAFFSNNRLTEFIPMEIFEKNNFHIVYSDMLFFIRHKSMINFSLFRLKFNNTLNLTNTKTITYSDNTQDIKSKQEIIKIPIEIVDLSVSSLDDNRSDYDNILFAPNTNHYQDINYSISNKITDIKEEKIFNILTTIPSANYMFYDIVEMLYIDNMFIWEDKKYGKRIGRLMYLSIICELSQGTTIDKLINDYTKFISFISEQNINSIDDFDLNINKIYEKIKTVKTEKMIVINNEQVINPRIHNIRPTKILKLAENKINFYLDLFISNYYESVILIKYFKHNNPSQQLNETHGSATQDVLEPEHFNYCEYQNQLLKDIENKIMLQKRMANQNNYMFSTDYSELKHYKTTKVLKNIADEFLKYNKTLILYSKNLIELLNEIKMSGITQINNFNFSSDKLY
jgi:hypothetical protein